MDIDLLITDCSLLPDPGEGAGFPAAFIALSGSRILQTGPMTACPSVPPERRLGAQGQLAMPGLINGHCHAPMTLFRGLADDLALATWLNEYIFPAEARHVHPEMVYWCTKLAAAEMLLGGITTVADGYFFEDEVARACAESGLRCIAAQGIIDFPAPGVADPAQNIETAARFLDHWQGRHPLITPAVFAHAPYTCSNTTLRAAKALARRYQAPFFIHLAETKEEIQSIAEPLASSPIQHAAALNLLDQTTVCIHCAWADAQDLDLLAATGAGVIVCPQSNLKLASGRAPLGGLLERGVPVGLGTDGAASNNSLDLFREMDLAAKIHKVLPNAPEAVPARQVLRMATHGGAKALGLPPGLGMLIPGAPADLILIDMDRPHLQPFHGPNNLVYGASAEDVQTVIVNGQIIVREKELLTMDLKETKQQIRRLSMRL